MITIDEKWMDQGLTEAEAVLLGEILKEYVSNHKKPIFISELNNFGHSSNYRQKQKRSQKLREKEYLIEYKSKENPNSRFKKVIPNLENESISKIIKELDIKIFFE